jgi:hypothetical protein
VPLGYLDSWIAVHKFNDRCPRIVVGTIIAIVIVIAKERIFMNQSRNTIIIAATIFLLIICFWHAAFDHDHGQSNSVHAQSTVTFYPLQTVQTGCVASSSGTTVCPVLQSNGTVIVGFAANGGAFTWINQPTGSGNIAAGSAIMGQVTCAPDKGKSITSGWSTACTIAVTGVTPP